MTKQVLPIFRTKCFKFSESKSTVADKDKCGNKIAEGSGFLINIKVGVPRDANIASTYQDEGNGGG